MARQARSRKLEATKDLLAWKASPGAPPTGRLRQAFTVLAVRGKPGAGTGQLFPAGLCVHLNHQQEGFDHRFPGSTPALLSQNLQGWSLGKPPGWF